MGEMERINARLRDIADDEITQLVMASYIQGMEAGIRRFAWWEDGRQMVGTCGTSLMTALRDLDFEYKQTCPHERFEDDDGVEYCGRCGIAKCAT
jgi:hypothetical protein